MVVDVRWTTLKFIKVFPVFYRLVPLDIFNISVFGKWLLHVTNYYNEEKSLMVSGPAHVALNELKLNRVHMLVWVDWFMWCLCLFCLCGPIFVAAKLTEPSPTKLEVSSFISRELELNRSSFRALCVLELHSFVILIYLYNNLYM